MGIQARAKKLKKIVRENHDLRMRVEVQDDFSLLWMLSRKCEMIIIEPEHASQIAMMLSRGALDAKLAGAELDPPAEQVIRESSQVKLRAENGYVHICFAWSDRIALSWKAAILISESLGRMEKIALGQVG